MRKLIAWNVATLDGYFEGPTPWSIDFHNLVFGKELQELSDEQLDHAGLLLFGRKTYEGMASYWPSAPESEAASMNNAPKAVISNTLDRVDWNNTRLLKGDGVELVRALKAEAGKTIFVFGSADLLSSLLAGGLASASRRSCSATVTRCSSSTTKPSTSTWSMPRRSRMVAC